MEEKTRIIRKILEEELALAKKHGVDNLGYRYFLPDGKSFGCTTVEEWYTEERNEEFYTQQKMFLWKEIKHLYDNKFSYVTRSANHKEGEYLESLKRFKLDNSVGIYKFGPDRIESVFFIYSPPYGERLDELINKIPELETHMNSITNKIDKVFYYISKNDSAEFIFEASKCRELFSQCLSRKGVNTKSGSLNILFNTRMINLSSREIELLRMLALNETNSLIASRLNVTVKRVEALKKKIKEKLRAESKRDLMHILNTPQFKSILS